jgi:hypothetical protein
VASRERSSIRAPHRLGENHLVLPDGRARRGPRRGTCAALGETDDDGERDIVEDVVPADDAQKLVEWLTLSWHPIQRALEE